MTHREGYSREETRLEKLGYVASKAFGCAGAAIFVVFLVFAVIVGVPALAVVRSESWLAARRFIAESDQVAMEIGDVESFERVPMRYKLGASSAEFVFDVQGRIAAGYAAVTVAKQKGVWEVTSASFLSDPRQPGVHQRTVLVRGR